MYRGLESSAYTGFNALFPIVGKLQNYRNVPFSNENLFSLIEFYFKIFEFMIIRVSEAFIPVSPNARRAEYVWGILLLNFRVDPNMLTDWIYSQTRFLEPNI